MALFLAWFTFPVLVCVLALGCGLLTRKIAAVRVPGVLLVPLGLTLIIVVSQVLTLWGATAELATPAVVALALAGYLTAALHRLTFTIDRWAVVATAAVFAVFAAPFVLSGEATFGGYSVQGDPVIHFTALDYVMSHGREVSGLKPSSYEFLVAADVGHSYPLGAQTALGALRPLVGMDVAWLFQPFLAILGICLCLTLYCLVPFTVERRSLRALVAFVASQPALLIGFYLQGSIKEVAAAWTLALVIALIPVFLQRPGSVRATLPLAVATAASISTIGAAVAPWLMLILLGALAAFVWASWPASSLELVKRVSAFALITSAMSLQSLTTAPNLIRVGSKVLTDRNEVGNLLRPLSKLQAVGIWLTGDFRALPGGTDLSATYVLIGVAFVSALLGAIWLARSGQWTLLLYLGSSLIGALYVVRRGSPWADAKALVIVSPPFLFLAMLGTVSLIHARRQLEGAALAAVITSAVLLSNAFAYHEVNLAPRDRFRELEKIGHRVAGQGPLLYTEFEQYAKHFLRAADPEGASDIRRRYMPLRDGTFAPIGAPTDTDQFTLRYLLYYRTLVLRRSPSLSRPPSPYALTFAGKHYEVWQRAREPNTKVLEHLPLGDDLQPSARPHCGEVRRLANVAREHGGQLAFVERPRSAVFVPSEATFPPSWTVDPTAPRSLIPNGPGRIEGTLRVPRSGVYTVWLGGSFGRGMRVSVDGRSLGDVSYELDQRGQYERVTDVQLAAGRHELVLLRGGGDLHPGNGGSARRVGPVVLSPVPAARRRIEYSGPSRADRLCRLELDWIEVVRR
jgi:hypothetical protein